MKRTEERTMKRTLGLVCLLTTSLVFGFAVARADVVLDWNAIAVDTFNANGADPFAQARYAAIVQLAVFEAVNSITGDYQPYLGTIVAPSGASAEAAAAQAAHDVLVTYFQNSQVKLDQQLAASLALIPDGQPKIDGIATGKAAAAAMIALRAKDGSSPPTLYKPKQPAPGVWQATPSCPVIGGVARGLFFNWQNVTPFGIPDVHAYVLDPPPLLTSNLYAKAYKEVMTVGSATSTERPQDRTNVATFYASSSPVYVFNLAARQVAQERWHSLSENARALALINMAISDSLVASFYNKYLYVFWRPETAIHAGDTDGNPKTEPDPNWAPFIGTPCFPSYPSNHGSGSNGGAEVLRRLYGEAGHMITISNPAVPGIVLQYTSFKQMTNDISDARVYGGIHFRTDQDAGERLGRAIGTAVYKNNLRAVHGPE
jgi:hypothetical protein